MPDHPQYAMWKARLEAEQAAGRHKAARRRKGEAEQADWNRAWEDYKERWRAGMHGRGLPPWWHLLDWVRILLGKPRP